MLAYVDESGCIGMQLGNGATPFFTVTAVLFKDRDVAQRCYDRIEDLASELKVTKEFHFSKLRHDHRETFFRAVNAFDFEYVSVAFDKQNMFTQGLVFSTPFLQYPVKAIFAAMAPQMDKSTIVVDKTGSSEFRKKLARELKQDINSQFDREVIRKIKEIESHKHRLLQLADMACGAVSRSLQQGKKCPHCYREIIRKRERLVSVWPTSA